MFKTITVNGKQVLVNFNNVTEVYSNGEGGCNLYFNFVNGGDQILLEIDENLDQLKSILGII